MSSHLEDELFKNGFNVVLGWDPERGFSLDVEADCCSYDFKEARFVTRRSMLMAEVIHFLSKQIPGK
jgi:hypothetical protein